MQLGKIIASAFLDKVNPKTALVAVLAGVALLNGALACGTSFAWILVTPGLTVALMLLRQACTASWLPAAPSQVMFSTYKAGQG